MYNKSDFNKFALSKGISSSKLHGYNRYVSRRGYINPVILEESELEVTPIDVFSRLMLDRQVFIGTDIEPEMANIINAQLLYLDNVSDEDVTILVNSPGGTCYDGLAILDTMDYIKPEISTICVGMAASMAAVILSAGEKGKRYILPHSRVMIHQPHGGAGGQASDILIEAEQIKILKDELCEIIAKNSGQPLDKVLVDCDRDYWMKGIEAVEYGLVDEIIKSKKK